MKKFVLGTLVGIGAACLYRNMKENGQLDKLTDDVNDLATKTKKIIADTLDAGKNQIEYLKDRAEYKVEKGIEKGKEAINRNNC